MATIVETFKAVLGVDVESGTQKSLDDLEDSLDSIVSGFGKMAAAAAVAVAGLVTATTVTNKHTATQTNLADALGISAEKMETWGFLLGAIGLDAESVVKTMRVLNDRIGELAQGAAASATLRRAVKQLNLEYKDLKDLAPEEQFERILQASQDAENGQLAMSAASEILGREGVKLVGWVRSQADSVAELLELQRQLNLQTDDGRHGAVRMTAAMDNLGAVTESTWKLFSGLVGETLAPIVESSNKWVAANRELIQQKIGEWAEGFGRLVNWLMPKIKRIVSWVTRLWETVDTFINKTIGWNRLLKILGVAVAALMAVLAAATVMKFAIALQKMAIALKALWLSALKPVVVLGLLFLVLEDIYAFLEGRESVIGDLLVLAEEWLGIDIVKPIRAAWPHIKDFVGNAWDLFSGYLTGVIQTVAGFVKFNIDIIGNLVKFIVDIFTQGLGPAWSEFIKSMGEDWHEFATGIVGVFEDAFNLIRDKFDFIIKPIRGFIKEVAGVIGIDTGVAVKRGDVSGPDFRQSAASSFGSSISNNRNSQNNVTVGEIKVVQQPGQSGNSLAKMVKNEIMTMAAVAVRSNSRGVDR